MLHLIPQMGKHRTPQVRLQFPNWVSRNSSCCFFNAPTSATKSHSHRFTPSCFLEDNRYVWFTAAGNSALLFECCVQLACYQSVNMADGIRSFTLQCVALMLTRERCSVCYTGGLHADRFNAIETAEDRIYVCE